LRVLIVTQYFWPESFRINDLAAGLKERGHEVVVLTGVPNYPSGRFFPGYGLLSPKRESHDGIPVVRVPLLPRGMRNRWRLALNYLSFALSASLLGPLRCRGDYDVILVYEVSPITVGLPAILLRRVKAAPMMFWVQDLWPESLSATGQVASPMVLRATAALARFIYRRCDRILVQSKGFIPRVEAAGADPRRVAYFPNWAETLYRPVTLPPDAPERHEMPPGFRILYAGNIGKAQSFETILEAARRLRDQPELQWVILGEGHERAWLEDRVAAMELKDRVHLLGSRPMETMPRYFAAADALLVTLRRDPIFALTIPSKLQSYLACGTPVLAALDGEGSRIVEESGGGLTCPAEDVEGLVRAVLTLYHMSASERASMGRKGRAYFESHFERTKLLDRLEGWMEALVRQPCGS
jgi:glycosyltransferase involved in cell wall biosynthesis